MFAAEVSTAFPASDRCGSNLPEKRDGGRSFDLEVNGDSFRLADSRRRLRRAQPEPPSDAAPQE